jgi:prepilin-type N-terminal cleavage/methylation domain-containing protein
MKTRGFTLMELMVGMTIMGALIIGTMTVFSETMSGFYRTKTDIDLASQNTLGMQRVAETLRGAYSMEIQNSGTKVVYYLPKKNATVDPTTGEREYTEPIQSDGVARSFTVTGGQLVDDSSGRVLAEKVVAKDPDPASSQYNQVYAPFQLTTIGSRKALSINFITQEEVLKSQRYQRMKTTVIIRNSL